MTAVLSRRSMLKTLGALALAPVAAPVAAIARAARWANFDPPVGICTSLDRAGLLKQHGVDYVEEAVGRMLMPDKPGDEFEKMLAKAKASPLPIRAANSFLPGSLPSVGPKADHDGVLKYARTAFERAKQIGIETIVFGSSASRSIPEGFDQAEAERQFIGLLKKMGPLAEAQNVVIGVEALQRSESNFINTIEHAARIVRAVDHPAIGLTVDIFHMLRMDEPAEHIRAAGGLVRHVHIAEKGERTPPGVDGDDFGPYLAALREIGYDGRISIECGWMDLAGQLPKAVEELRGQIASARRD